MVMPSVPRPSLLSNRRGERITAKLIVVSLFGAVVSFVCLLSSRAQGPSMSVGGDSQSSTTWRPNRTEGKYVGAQVCARCHADEAATQHATAMGRAAQTVDTSEVLRSNPRLIFRSGRYAYEITRRSERSFYTVTD